MLENIYLVPQDCVTNLELHDLGAHPLHHAAELLAQDDGGLLGGGDVHPDPPPHAPHDVLDVEAGGPHPHQHLVSLHLGHGHGLGHGEVLGDVRPGGGLAGQQHGPHGGHGAGLQECLRLSVPSVR